MNYVFNELSLQNVMLVGLRVWFGAIAAKYIVTLHRKATELCVTPQRSFVERIIQEWKPII